MEEEGERERKMEWGMILYYLVPFHQHAEQKQRESMQKREDFFEVDPCLITSGIENEMKME